jgi:5'-nucleotidase
MTRLSPTMIRSAALLAATVSLAGSVRAQAPPAAPEGAAGRVTLSIVGTTDLHGRIFPDRGRGGLAMLGGYLRNLRAARAADGGAVLLLDAGDTFESGILSNISEGALVVDAYNALGYDALAIGNHEFDYGAVDTASREDGTPDMRGALKAAAARARFPFLTANVIEAATGRPLDWPNVRPSTLVETAGLRVGIVGVMTRYGLTRTITANVQGLDTTALEPVVEREARRLRRRGADVVLVLAHAGGACFGFDDPVDLSSCDDDAEIFQLARQLPPGLVDAIVAGHTHRAVAHEVAGIPIVQAYSHGRAFARVDLTVQRDAGVVAARLFPPQAVCAAVDTDGWSCATDGGTPASYEAAPVRADEAIVAAMQPELDRVNRWRAEPLGVTLATPLPRNPNGIESPLGNLFADAILAAVPDADLAIGMGGRRAGLRRDLAAGALTRGALYDVFAFDNRVVRLTMTAAQVEQALERSFVRGWGGIPAVAGIRVRVACDGTRRNLEIVRPSGAPVGRTETLTVATTDFFVRRTAFDTGVTLQTGALPTSPLVREAVADWVAARGGRLRATDFSTPPRWETPERGACLAVNTRFR